MTAKKAETEWSEDEKKAAAEYERKVGLSIVFTIIMVVLANDKYLERLIFRKYSLLHLSFRALLFSTLGGILQAIWV
jgi:hypothetical protein